MNGNDFDALIRVLEAELNTKGDTVLTTSGLLSRMRKAQDPEASKAFDRPAPSPQLPQPPPEFPKLKVRYDRQTGQPIEHVICQTIYDEVSYQTWNTRPLAELDEVRRQIECAG